MNLASFISLIVFGLANSITPGPNVICSFSTSLNYGVKKSLSVVAGIGLGFILVFSIGFCLLMSIGEINSKLMFIFKIFGFLYLLYLAIKITKNRMDDTNNSKDKPSIKTGLILQVLNAKLLLYAFIVLSTFILPYTKTVSEIFIMIILLAIIEILCNLIWVFGGSFLKPFLIKYESTVNKFLALLIVMCAFKLFI